MAWASFPSCAYTLDSFDIGEKQDKVATEDQPIDGEFNSSIDADCYADYKTKLSSGSDLDTLDPSCADSTAFANAYSLQIRDTVEVPTAVPQKERDIYRGPLNGNGAPRLTVFSIRK